MGTVLGRETLNKYLNRAHDGNGQYDNVKLQEELRDAFDWQEWASEKNGARTRIGVHPETRERIVEYTGSTERYDTAQLLEEYGAHLVSTAIASDNPVDVNGSYGTADIVFQEYVPDTFVTRYRSADDKEQLVTDLAENAAAIDALGMVSPRSAHNALNAFVTDGERCYLSDLSVLDEPADKLRWNHLYEDQETMKHTAWYVISGADAAETADLREQFEVAYEEADAAVRP